MKKSVLVTRKIPDLGIKVLIDKDFEVDVNLAETPLSQKQIIKLIGKKPYDAVITLLTDKINKNVFDSAKTVKIYANYATGFDNIDVTEAKNRNIVVTNAPAELASEAVAEHTIALMLALAARIVEADEFVRQGKYNGWSPMNFIGTDVLGKTLGLIGAGRIGERVALYSKGLGMKIVYHDINRNERVEKQYGGEYLNSVDDVLQKADIVSLHVPLLSSTKHLINATRLKLMKNTGLLVNTSRGAVVDEQALIDALQNGVIAGAALDVFEFEPKISRSLVKLPNVILTPHIASASVAARDQMSLIVAKNIIDFFDGKTPPNIVNP